MNEWLKQALERLKTLWGKWTTVQKIIFFAIIGGLLLAVILVATLSAQPSVVPLITTPITDEDLRQRISVRLDEENVDHSITADGRIMVEDRETARRMVMLLESEGLMPDRASAWDIFKMDRWTVTQFEREVKLRQAIMQNLEQHIESLDDVDNAEVTLVLPDTAIFAEDQQPVKASIIVTPAPGSDLSTNRKQLEGIVSLVQRAVEGLDEENITITDHRGVILNNFADLADFDTLELAKRQMQQKASLEADHKRTILNELQGILTKDRVRVVNVSIDVSFDKQTENLKEFLPMTLVPDDPTTPYKETEVTPNVLRSEESVDESFRGTGFNPEGPPGQEGQIPPAYQELDDLVGTYDRGSTIKNYEINERNSVTERSPWQIERKTIAVAIDGIWKKQYDSRGNIVLNPDGSILREYQPVSDETLQKARELVQAAIGFDRARGDVVNVQHIQFDRTAEHLAEDQKYRNQARLRQTVLFSLIGLAGVIIAFVVFRLISRELERRRRLREEELSRQHQAMREAALRSAEEEGLDVEMSVEERARMEMQEHAINMAREHPEDVAQLIRTWLVEE